MSWPRNVSWDSFVDAVTLLWLGLFFADQVRLIGQVSETVLLALLPIYIADLVVQYRRVGQFRLFLRKHWLTILMTIPYLRVLRLVRLVRLLRVLKAVRVARIVRWPGLQRAFGAMRKARRLSGRREKV